MLPLDVLSDSRLGIDAAYYLQSLQQPVIACELLLAATGGLPFDLTTHIKSDLLTSKLRIKPVFVFPGLTPNKHTRHLQQNRARTPSSRTRVVTATWCGANSGRVLALSWRRCAQGHVSSGCQYQLLSIHNSIIFYQFDHLWFNL